jgi:hypothetical protein
MGDDDEGDTEVRGMFEQAFQRSTLRLRQTRLQWGKGHPWLACTAAATFSRAPTDACAPLIRLVVVAVEHRSAWSRSARQDVIGEAGFFTHRLIDGQSAT